MWSLGQHISSGSEVAQYLMVRDGPFDFFFFFFLGGGGVGGGGLGFSNFVKKIFWF